MFGTPKVACNDGTLVDIWSVHPRGLAAEMSAYSHNVDAISWSLRKREFDDPLSIMPQIEARQLSIRESFLKRASKLETSYAILKALYLCIRHRYTPSDSLAKLLSEPIVVSPFMRKNAIRLAKELSVACHSSLLGNITYGRGLDDTAESLFASALPDRNFETSTCV
jgi:hypothetical protein